MAVPVTKQLVVSDTTAVETASLYGVTLMPNPVRDILKVSFPESSSGLKEVSIFNMLGKNVLLQQTTESQINLSVSALLPGVYTLTIRDYKQYLSYKFAKK